MSSACTCHIDVNSCLWCKLQRIKFQTNLNFDIATKNAHVLNKNDYIKLNTFISYEDLFWLIEQAEKAEIYNQALVNTYVEGMTIEEILKESDKWGEIKREENEERNR